MTLCTASFFFHYSCKMHLARVLCRRAERAVSRLEHEYHYTGSVLRYLNRLSDYFFAAARACALWYASALIAAVLLCLCPGRGCALNLAPVLFYFLLFFTLLP